MSLESDIECPVCKHNLKLKYQNIFPGSSYKCSFCGTNISFEGDDCRKLQKELDSIESFDIDINIEL